jgi:hypothetical protein
MPTSTFVFRPQLDWDRVGGRDRALPLPMLAWSFVRGERNWLPDHMK